MHLFEAIIFGVVQGITEFLPISSTAHIIIAELLLGYNFPGLAFEIYLHIASVFAVMLYFRKELAAVVIGFFSYFREKNTENRIQFMFGLYIIVATAITGGLGLLLKGAVADTMKTPAFIAGALVVTGSALIAIERFTKYGDRREEHMTFMDSVIVGLGQTVAVLPGISRSGSTLVTALWSGLDRDTAVRYSFLLSIPVILGSTVLALGELSSDMWAAIGVEALFVSFVVTFVFSWIGIVWLIDFLKKGRLLYFAIYCYIVAILVFLFVQELPPGLY
ncbi:undecaprenyl-diphosphate phosphatase [Dethiobacter alkaliphilus]|uniref:undecaprenyl-diphosphate phosphatase n=1 Tax=Dethiobacter alkaliphilus TaxID=427926 RepID=UPI0022266899|nr:undecaprenyl-diphosphate phosphatase [Dethiobacter alkaliphilus]MCW3489423.1 undecaprenyl-diphosphatase [Dethiobacter alkaliphilus]